MERQLYEGLGYRVFRTYRALHECLSETLAPFDINPSQWGMLNRLEQNGPMNQAKLAAAVQRQPATVTNTVDRLIKAGYVKRIPNPTDRRENIITLTPKAQEVLPEIKREVSKLNADIARGMTPEQLEPFFATLDAVFGRALSYHAEQADAPTD